MLLFVATLTALTDNAATNLYKGRKLSQSTCLYTIKLKLQKPKKKDGGGERARTDDIRLAKPALSQLSYTPMLNPPSFTSILQLNARYRTMCLCQLRRR